MRNFIYQISRGRDVDYVATVDELPADVRPHGNEPVRNAAGTVFVQRYELRSGDWKPKDPVYAVQDPIESMYGEGGTYAYTNLKDMIRDFPGLSEASRETLRGLIADPPRNFARVPSFEGIHESMFLMVMYNDPSGKIELGLRTKPILSQMARQGRSKAATVLEQAMVERGFMKGGRRITRRRPKKQSSSRGPRKTQYTRSSR